MAASWQTAVIPACVAVWLLAFGLGKTEITGAAPVMARAMPALTADAHFSDPPRPAATPNADIGNVAVVTSDDLPKGIAADATLASPEPEAPASHEPQPSQPVEPEPSKPTVVAALTDTSEVLPPDAPPVQAAIADTPAEEAGNAAPAVVKSVVGTVEVLDECFVIDACVDRYLWALYQRTPKEDSIKEEEQRKVTIKRKGKLVTVTRTFTKLVDEDFAWKDPKAADKAGMPMKDYVIGGVDPGFKLKLFRMLLAAEQAGLSPGITSAFRDDYRQSIASGLKAANNRSYHGGSFRGGYGHGLAADVVGTNGATRAQRYASSEILWKWIDAHGKDFGIGRPYLDHDPPHVAPIDGQEYAAHNGGKRRAAAAEVKKRSRTAARAVHVAAKRDTPKRRIMTAAR